MLKRTKNISIFVVITCFVMQLCIPFSETLIEHIQEIRTQIQLSKIHLAEKKSITLSEWKSFDDKEEIKLNNVYYDVISFEILPDKVVINAIEDKYENNFRIVLNNLLNKKGTHHSSKKKPHVGYNYITILTNNDYKIENYFNLLSMKSNFYTPKGDINKISLAIYRPPC